MRARLRKRERDRGKRVTAMALAAGMASEASKTLATELGQANKRREAL